ncbi:MAG: hypothetical protein HC810_04400 [Acaryochloridaceae cyanobacterium RL_2_7]|nr:hypothetical protein [Acaryochloridaceae cyanobacterium RL_2_7]
MRFVLDLATRRLISQKVPEAATVPFIEDQLTDAVRHQYRWYSTPILVRNIAPHERGRLYLFSHDPNYAWSETRQKLAQLVADQPQLLLKMMTSRPRSENKSVWPVS